MVFKATHGHTRKGKQSGAYRSWSQMRGRCLLPSNSDYERYGAIGITICERWLDFQNFLDDMGERPDGMTLDRIDGSKGYSPENCRWATVQQQNVNRITSNMITYRGETKCMAEWARNLGIKKVTLRHRLKKYGWPVEKAFTTPVDFANGLITRGQVSNSTNRGPSSS